MASRNDLEQDVQILEAELEQSKRELYETQREVELLRGQVKTVQDAATAAGVALAPLPKTEAEQALAHLEQVRAGVSSDLQALDELRTPPPLADGKVETPIELVRANQRERAELQATLARANGTLSRIAAALKVDKWNDEAGQAALVDRINQFAMLDLKVRRRIADLQKNNQTAETAFWISCLEWVIDEGRQKAQVNYNAPRIINFVLNGHVTPVDAKPEQSLKYLLGVALATADLTTAPVDHWMVFSPDGERLKLEIAARDVKATRVVASLPVGSGG